MNSPKINKRDASSKNKPLPPEVYNVFSRANESENGCMFISSRINNLCIFSIMNFTMHTFIIKIFYLALVGFSIASSSNTTIIHFYSDETGCVNHFFGCSSLPRGYCCAASYPYCRWIQCVDCHAQNTTNYELLAHTNGNCSGDPSFSCTATAIDSCCKVNHAAESEADICSAIVVPEGSGLERDYECLGTREPNILGLRYGDGTVMEIKLPHGTYQLALTLAANHDFDRLVAHLV